MHHVDKELCLNFNPVSKDTIFLLWLLGGPRNVALVKQNHKKGRNIWLVAEFPLGTRGLLSSSF